MMRLPVRVRPVTAVCVSLVTCASLLGCGGSQTSATLQSASRPGSPPPASASTSTTNAATASRAPVVHRVPPRPHVQRPSPGSLPQTARLPSADRAEFRARLDGLWHGIATGSLDPALPALFPEGAYAQLKAIGDPRGDFVNRLEADYRLDLLAAHSLLGAHAASAHLVRVIVPSDYAHWVPPGVCYNDVGYYETPNSRLVYSEDGQIRSIGIASMISWRGVWYVVHLGAILRSSDAGLVDEPADGPGSSSYSGTC